MVLDTETIIDVCVNVAYTEQLKVTIQETTKGALITGVGAFTGGFFGGPVGMAVGGCVGSLTAYRYCGNFRSVGDILKNDLTPAQQRKLKDSVGKILNSITAEDVMAVAAVVLSSQNLKQTLLKEIASFLAAELNLRMIM